MMVSDPWKLEQINNASFFHFMSQRSFKKLSDQTKEILNDRLKQLFVKEYDGSFLEQIKNYMPNAIRIQ